MFELKSFAGYIKSKIDWALVLAAVTEIPRWAIAFTAVNEPIWVGVPLGALLAWAMKEGWEKYFATKHPLLLFFNIWTLVSATFVISPVLYTMITHEMGSVTLEHFRIAEVDPFLMIWSAILATTTFIPLIVIAAVRAHSGDMQAEPVEKIEVLNVPAIQPSLLATEIRASKVKVISDDKFNGHENAKIELQGLTSKERQEQLRLMRMNDHASTPKNELAQMFGVSPATITRDFQILGIQ